MTTPPPWLVAALAVVGVLILAYFLYVAYTNHGQVQQLHTQSNELLRMLRELCASLHVTCPSE